MFNPNLIPASILSILLLTTPISSASCPKRPSPIPATGTCSAGIGTPGAFYICPEPNFQAGKFGCEYKKADGVCLSWPVGNPSSKSRSIGPDIGGVCDFYASTGCQGQVVRSLECPGLSDTGDRTWFGSMKCRAK